MLHKALLLPCRHVDSIKRSLISSEPWTYFLLRVLLSDCLNAWVGLMYVSKQYLYKIWHLTLQKVLQKMLCYALHIRCSAQSSFVFNIQIAGSWLLLLFKLIHFSSCSNNTSFSTPSCTWMFTLSTGSGIIRNENFLHFREIFHLNFPELSRICVMPENSFDRINIEACNSHSYVMIFKHWKLTA